MTEKAEAAEREGRRELSSQVEPLTVTVSAMAAGSVRHCRNEFNRKRLVPLILSAKGQECRGEGLDIDLTDQRQLAIRNIIPEHVLCRDVFNALVRSALESVERRVCLASLENLAREIVHRAEPR